MANVFTYDLPLISHGEYILLKASSHCRSKFKVHLINKSSNSIVGNEIVKDNNTEGLVNYGGTEISYTGDTGKLAIEIISEENRNIIGQVHNGIIYKPDGSIAGSTYTICIEDETDNDYNDIYVTIASWKGGR